MLHNSYKDIQGFNLACTAVGEKLAVLSIPGCVKPVNLWTAKWVRIFSIFVFDGYHIFSHFGEAINSWFDPNNYDDPDN